MAEIGEEGMRGEERGAFWLALGSRLSWAEDGEEAPKHLFSPCTVGYLVEMY
jgi:hypothetical protein